ncbi:hypothetical protein L6R29_16815 [Myxococcota bacterium]|nr:hypothetical protein [Myxococcota bacterium]
MIWVLWADRAWSAEGWPEGVAEVARWSTSIRSAGTWSQDGRWIAYTDKSAGHTSLFRYTLDEKKRQEIGQSTNSFFPSFGPLGLIFGGPATDPPATLALWHHKNKRLRKVPPPRSFDGNDTVPKKDTEDPSGDSSAPAKKNPVDPTEDTDIARAVKQQGIMLFGKQHQAYLFPGWHPQYSHGARRLVFVFQGFVYLWDPLQDRKTGLLLLTRGEAPVWEPQGRALTFLRWPFRRFADGSVGGGGVSVVDLLFRGTKLTPCGGEVTWSPDASGLYIVASARCWKRIQQRRTERTSPSKPLPRTALQRKPAPRRTKPKAGGKSKRPPKTEAKRPAPALLRGSSVLFWQPLKGETPPIKLAEHAEAPDCPKQTNTLYRDLVAYADPKGVWLLHRLSQKRRLIAPNARFPRWSSRGHLLVQYPDQLVVLRLYPRLLQEIAN